MAILEVRSLTKRYGAIQALDGVTLSLEGGAVGLLGPNGAGKSTLIKILLGFVSPSSGEARVLDMDATRAPLAVREQIGYMPENESFVPGMTAVGWVHLAARLVGLSHQDAMQRTHMVLNYVGLNEERYRNVESFSTGMKQKAKLAQALVHHPKLLLLDEPTAGLDPRGREEMLRLIRDVAHGKGIHVVLSTHILPDVEEVCDRVVVMNRGKVVAQDEVKALIGGSTDHYEVRIKGDPAVFARSLAAQGCAVEENGESLLVGGGTDRILRAAVETGVQVRHLGRPRNRLEDLFARLIGEP